jgi:hypothetical protein
MNEITQGDRHELTRIQRTKDRADLERSMLDAIINDATNLPAMRIGDRDPDKGMDTVIFPDGGQAIAGLRLFNASVSPDQIIKSTQPYDSPVIRLDYKSHRETEKTTSTPARGKIKILYRVGSDYFIGGYTEEPIAISLPSPPTLYNTGSTPWIPDGIDNLGGDEYIVRLRHASSRNIGSLSTRPLHQWTYSITLGSVGAGATYHGYGSWGILASAPPGGGYGSAQNTYYSFYGGSLVGAPLVGGLNNVSWSPGIIYATVGSVAFPSVLFKVDIYYPEGYGSYSESFGKVAICQNDTGTVAIGFAYNGFYAGQMPRKFAPSNLTGTAIPSSSFSGVYQSFVGEMIYNVSASTNWTTETTATVTSQDINSTTSAPVENSEPFYKIPPEAIFIAASYHPD